MEPNGSELVDAYADAFENVFQNIDRALAIYDKKEKYIPVEERIAHLGEESSLPTANERELISTIRIPDDNYMGSIDERF